ncbi:MULTISPECIES: hypothetical protein [unclassified Pseudomonas]|uniref:hypothetical protein n=1 Tax=unclassified Pseudomonas TaxID=196821 RepID=UPI000A1EFA0C|nr:MULTISPECIES: hypothetical protein [unclassified Pseudomonas]
MTKATQATKTKAVRKTRRCKNPDCKKPFSTSNAKKLYCNSTCATRVQNKKRPRVDRLDKARRTPFFFYLARECKRAGTLEILTGHTAATLTHLYNVWKYAFRANQYGSVRDFEISHIAPVENGGLLHAENLCLAPKSMNKAHGTSHFGYGKKISRTGIASAYAVKASEAEGSVLDRVISYIGEQVVEEFVRIAKLQPSQRFKHMDWLNDHLDPFNPEHRKHIDALDGMSTKALSDLKNELQHLLPGSFAVKRYVFQSFDVLRHELERFVQYRPDLSVIVERMQEVDALMPLRAKWSVQSEEEQALFDLLHGKEFDVVSGILDDMISRNTPAVEAECDDDGLERVLAYAPLKIPFHAIASESGTAYTLAAPY